MTEDGEVQFGPVLIVDDDLHNLQLTSKIVHAAGYPVIMAQDGLSALEICTSVTPSAILLDIMMPEMNGLEICKRMKEDPVLADIPIIFLSAAGEEEMIEQGIQYGGTDFVSKPVRERTLLTRLRVHMERGFLQKSLNEQNKKLDEQNRQLIENELSLKQSIQKLHILSGITRHDILNKITALNGYISLMREEISSQDGLDYSTRARDTVEIIQKQITFTRDYQEMGINSPIWQNIKSIVNEATNSLNIQTVHLVKNLDNTECYADPLLPRVFYNLIENSFRHGKNITTIQISNEIRDDCYVIVVEDDGGGIPPTEKENIFCRKFYKNTGFGLFLSRDILQITNFTIQEKGEYNRGARFEIRIPKGYYRHPV